MGIEKKKRLRSLILFKAELLNSSSSVKEYKKVLSLNFKEKSKRAKAKLKNSGFSFEEINGIFHPELLNTNRY